MFLMLKQCRCETKYPHDDCAFLRWTRTACKVVSGEFPTEQLPTEQLRTGPQPLWCMAVNVFSIQYECIHPFKVYVKTKAARMFYFMLYQVRDLGRAHILMIGTAPMMIIPNINSDVSTWKCHFLFSYQMLPGVKHYLEQKKMLCCRLFSNVVKHIYKLKHYDFTLNQMNDNHCIPRLQKVTAKSFSEIEVHKVKCCK